MKHSKKLIAALSGLLLCSPGVYAKDATVAPNGTITPAPCEMTVGLVNGEIDFGRIPASSLNAGANTTLPPQDFSVDVTCAGPTQIGFRMTDNRYDSRQGLSGYYGLGYSPMGAMIGSYNVIFESVLAQGQEITRIVSLGGNGNWRLIGGILFRPTGDIISGAEDPSRLIPYASTTFRFQFQVIATIAGNQGMTFEDDIPLDGSSVLEMVYL